MKINKVLLVLSFPVMAQLLFSCCCCDDDSVSYNPSGIEGTRSIEGIDLFFVDNSGAEPIKLSNNANVVDKINKNAFGIEMTLLYSEFAKADCSPSPNFNFFGTLIACSCDTESPDFGINKEKIKNFKIVTLNDFDSTKLKGADITQYFNFYFQNDFSIIDQGSLESVWYDRLMLLLEDPKLDSIFQFEISFDVNDTLSVKDTTRQVHLF